jgi:hypothetical protein
MRQALKTALAGILGFSALAMFASAPATAGGDCCDCGRGYGYGGYGYTGYGYAPPPGGFVYQPSASFYQVGPRGYAGYYYAPTPPPVYYAPPPPPPVYGYGYVNRGPAVVIERRPRWYGPRW